jgi:hypothetical protein
MIAAKIVDVTSETSLLETAEQFSQINSDVRPCRRADAIAQCPVQAGNNNQAMSGKR